MKNIFFVVVLILTSFSVTAQTKDVEIEKEKSKVTLSDFKLMIHFKDLADLKEFRTEVLEDMKILNRVNLESPFSFGFTLGEAIETEAGKEAQYAIKVEIKEVDNKEALLKEINDAMDGVVELYELQNKIKR